MEMLVYILTKNCRPTTEQTVDKGDNVDKNQSWGVRFQLSHDFAYAKSR